MGSGQSNEAKHFPLSLNPSYTSFPRTNNFTSTTTASPRSTTCTTPGITFHLLQPNHLLGKGQEEIFHEQAMLGAENSYASAYCTTTSTTSRWNPTPEQLLALEEMYKRGMRNPTTDEIQQIASQLRRFGNIEGKNVFYWFQNHKARERQKRRREGENNSKVQTKDVEIPDRKESGMRRSSTVHDEFLLTKNSVSSEGLVPMHRAADNKAENGTHGWSQFQEIGESPRQKNTSPINHDTWQKGFPSSSSPPFSPPTFNESSFQGNPEFLTFERHECNFSNTLEVEAREIQTLQLFPLCGGENGYFEGMVNCTKKDTEVPITTINTNFSASQFFEFLPPKN